DPAAAGRPREISPSSLVPLAEQSGARIMASTYNEPLITSEWAVEVFQEGKKAGLLGAYVSNGNGTREVLEYIRPWVDLYRVDLKSFRDPAYRALGGQLKIVLETLARLKETGFWVEVVTLIIPGFNDSDAELLDIARFLVSLSPEI